MDSRQQFRTIWAYRRWLALFVVLTALVTYVLSKGQPQTFKATALAQLVSAAEASGQVLAPEEQQTITNSYLRIAQTPGVYTLGARNVGGHITPSEFASHVSVNPETDTAVFDVSGTAGSASQSVSFANAYASAFSTYVEELQTHQRQAAVSRLQQQISTAEAGIAATTSTVRADQLREQLRVLQTKVSETVAAPSDSVRVLGSAPLPASPVSPQPKRNAILALIVSLILGCGVIIAYSALADRYRDSDEVAADIGLALLGEVPRAALYEQAAIESFRRLRTAMIFELTGRHAKRRGARAGSRGAAPEASNGKAVQHCSTVLITAADRGAGKSYTTVGLSRSLATDGWRTVAVDGDLRKPTLHHQLGLRPSPGLADVLEDREDLDGVMQHASAGSAAQGNEFDVIVAGPPTVEATELLTSARMRAAMGSLTERYDYVVLDSSPVLPVVDAVVLARNVDGVVLVVDARRSRRRDVRRTVQTLRATDANVLGFVFNRATQSARYYGYGEPGPSAEGRVRRTSEAVR
jgi:polysaccharide biosynthesis transport protein